MAAGFRQAEVRHFAGRATQPQTAIPAHVYGGEVGRAAGATLLVIVVGGRYAEDISVTHHEDNKANRETKPNDNDRSQASREQVPQFPPAGHGRRDGEHDRESVRREQTPYERDCVRPAGAFRGFIRHRMRHFIACIVCGHGRWRVVGAESCEDVSHTAAFEQELRQPVWLLPHVVSVDEQPIIVTLDSPPGFPLEELQKTCLNNVRILVSSRPVNR